MTGSTILQGDTTVTAALHAVTVGEIPTTAISGLNDAIFKYEKDRGGPVRRLVAGPLGFDAIPQLTLATGS